MSVAVQVLRNEDHAHQRNEAEAEITVEIILDTSQQVRIVPEVAQKKNVEEPEATKTLQELTKSSLSNAHIAIKTEVADQGLTRAVTTVGIAIEEGVTEMTIIAATIIAMNVTVIDNGAAIRNIIKAAKKAAISTTMTVMMTEIATATAKMAKKGISDLFIHSLL